MSGGFRLSEPRPIRVEVDPREKAPARVDGRRVEAIRESWLIEDRWWTATPLRRRYWEVVTVDGRNLTIFRDLERGDWYSQR